jgi:hypothetical protein
MNNLIAQQLQNDKEKWKCPSLFFAGIQAMDLQDPS